VTEANVFEDQGGIRFEGGWLRRVHECELIPEGYGVAWWQPMEAIAICAPLPWHQLVGWVYRTYHRFRRNERSPEVVAFQAGMAERDRACEIQVGFIRDQKATEVEAAYIRGRRDQLDELVARAEHFHWTKH